jgi:dolichol-phosphate mannosyltransferase
MSRPAGKTAADVVRTIYDRRFDDASRDRKAQVWRVIVEHHLQRWVRPSDTVLDVGSGFGEFLNHVKCTRRIGVDLNPDSKNHLEPGIEFHQADATRLSMIADESVDVVFSSNFMEHLPDKGAVEGMIDEVFRILRRGGHFIALGPNVRVLPGDYWDFWDHHVAISDRSLTELLETRGFQVTDAVPRFLPYTTRSSLPQAPWLVRLYLAFPPMWRVLGGQFLIRAEKR